MRMPRVSARLLTSDGWKEDAEKHQEAVGAAHDCGVFQ